VGRPDCRKGAPREGAHYTRREHVVRGFVPRLESPEHAVSRHESSGIVYLTFENLTAVPGLVHAVSTRTGGVSLAPLDSLNMGFHAEDDLARVLENRRRLVSALGFALRDVVTTHQLHGTNVRVVGRTDAGQGAFRPCEESWASDALVTRDSGLLLMAFSADCPLVMLADAESQVVGLAHAGWRSAFGGILAGTLGAMKQLGARPERVAAAISPAIGPCCYEVGGELKEAAPLDRETSTRLFREHGDKFLFDLPAFAREMLKRSGVREERIESTDLCTRCHQEMFFSARGSPRTGRYAAVIGWLASQTQDGAA